MAKWLGFAGLVLIYGSIFMFISVAVEQITPLELAVIRLSIATVCLFMVIRLTNTPIPLTSTMIQAYIIIGLLNVAIPFVLIAWAQTQNLDSGLTGVLVTMNPLFTLVIAHFVFEDERMTPASVIGIATGFIGTLILATRNWQNGEIILDGLLGQAAVVFCAFLFAAMGVFGRHTMQKNTVKPMAMATMTSLVALVSTGSLLLVNYLFLDVTPTPLNTLELQTIGSIMVLGFISSFVAFYLTYFVLRELGATRTSMMTYIIPIISLFLGALLLDELIDSTVILGTVVILSGLAIVNLTEPLLRRLRPAVPLQDVPVISTPELDSETQ